MEIHEPPAMTSSNDKVVAEYKAQKKAAKKKKKKKKQKKEKKKAGTKEKKEKKDAKDSDERDEDGLRVFVALLNFPSLSLRGEQL